MPTNVSANYYFEPIFRSGCVLSGKIVRQRFINSKDQYGNKTTLNSSQVIIDMGNLSPSKAGLVGFWAGEPRAYARSYTLPPVSPVSHFWQGAMVRELVKVS